VGEILGSLLPIFALIVLGAVFRATGFLDAGFWRPAERLTYFILLPALLVENLATADLAGLPLYGPVIIILVSLLVMSALLLRLRRAIAPSGPEFTSVLQGAIRFNSYIGLAAATSLYGKPGLTVAAIAILALVPVGNTISVLALARYGSGKTPGVWATARAVIGNPLIVACLIGAALGLVRIGLPFGTAPLLHILGTAALPLGLLAVGAALDFASFRANPREIAASVAAKLVAVPLLSWGSGRLLGIGGVTLAVTILFQALPTAPSSYIMARQLGGDHTLMAAILTVQTLASVVTLPIVLWLLG
jgi:malonate transporter